MSDFKTRLTIEEAELKTKIEKLYDFTQSETFAHLDKVEQAVILIQREAMGTYWRCLTTRIDVIG